MIYVGDKKYSLYVGDKRREMIVPKSLPYDAEVEYLESVNKNQYVDTGIIVSSPYSIYGKFLAIGEQLSWNAYIFFGAGYAYNNSNIECFTGNTASNLTVLHGNYHEFVYPYNTIPFTVYYRNKEFTVTNGQDTYQYTSTNTSLETPFTMGLFALHRSSWTGSSKPVRCYWFKIEDENNTTLIDLIPVRVGTTGYMYDKVSGQLFGNSGTGDFVLGPDKVEWPLKYWLSGEDALVDQKWVDRINPDIQWTVGGAVTHDTENNRYLFMGRTGRWQKDYRATLPANLINLYNFGYHWKMIVRGEFLYAPATMTSEAYFIDFAAVRQANFNISWGTWNKGFVQNFKTAGNSTIYSCVDHSLLADATSNPYPFEVEFGCEAVSETTSRLYTLYDGTYYYGATFNNMLFTNWQSGDFYIGMGYAGRSYGCDFYLNDWKIYVEPYNE